MKKQIMIIGLISLALLAGCSDKEKTKSITEGGMKCGAGKCGASMANGSALLVKKKMNIIDQMDKNDTRRNCVLKAKTTKALYACVRVTETGRLSTKCSSDKTKPKVNLPRQKCESGKCNSAMKNGAKSTKCSTEKKAPKKETISAAKCETGKCNTAMQKK
ncbi:MAG TPA: hypothetical protein ENK39_03755 [Epsilonproteobacteria bacterium]|nr:hypothetical protein [Campylobacterota bacterium]